MKRLSTLIATALFALAVHAQPYPNCPVTIAVLAADEVKARFVGLGGVPRATTPVEFDKLIGADRKRYARIIKDRKITVD